MASELIEVLRHLLGDEPDAGTIDDVDAWWERHLRVAAPFVTPIGRAFAGGFAADRLGYAFASGYEEALAALVPPLAGIRAALCVTEEGGNRPREVTTELTPKGEGFVVSGTKTFVTLGGFADELLVVATEGRDDHDRNRLRLLRLPKGRAGLRLETLPRLPFVPEIPHATLTLESVEVSPAELLPGDAYDEYVKPFRTVEDLHVLAAVIGYLARVGRQSDWPSGDMEALGAFASAIFPLGLADPLDASVHVALGGIFRRLRVLLEHLDWQSTSEPTRVAFERDRKILDVANDARVRRLSIAWRRLGHQG